jgi:hypothetical protein
VARIDGGVEPDAGKTGFKNGNEFTVGEGVAVAIAAEWRIQRPGIDTK